ncbi:MAG: PEGA domain-containing protein [Methanoregula sp.]|nr:PEGA domain-containing protein [Methanoregula sp.]
MKTGFWIVLILAILISVCMVPAVAEDTTVGGDQGWYAIYCNVYGAKIYLDDKYITTTPQEGAVTIPVYIATPYKTIRVQKYGYSTFTDSISNIPENGETVNLYTTLNKIPDTTQTVVGGDVGWYVVHCNIDGATVFFDESNRGEISQGMVYVPVYSTGLPFSEYTVKKDGYTTFTATIANVPGKGETIDLYATLNPVATTTTTPAMIGGDTGWYAVHCNVDGATVTFDNDAKGQITQGTLKVQVYVTGTPYKTFTVYKAGYVPYTGTINKYPGKGETVDLSATLTAEPATTTLPTSVPTQKSPVTPGLCGLALVIGVVIASVVSRK